MQPAQNGGSPNALVELPKEGAYPQPPSETAASVSRPEAVTVAEPPGQITGCGQPIGIVFNATQAGAGILTASCLGAKVGEVATTVTQLREGVLSVKFTPNVADVYTLHVKWGGKDITGSPFNINLGRLAPAPQEQKAKLSPAPQEPKAKLSPAPQGPKATEQREKEEEVVEEVSDDPFDMAYQASRLLGEYCTT